MILTNNCQRANVSIKIGVIIKYRKFLRVCYNALDRSYMFESIYSSLIYTGGGEWGVRENFAKFFMSMK